MGKKLVEVFTYYIHDGPTAFRLQLAGSLTDAAAAELEQCVNTAFSTIGSRAFAVDTSRLTAVGDVGQELLRRWGREGAQFSVATPQEKPSFRFFRLAFASSALLLVLLTVARAAGFVR